MKTIISINLLLTILLYSSCLSDFISEGIDQEDWIYINNRTPYDIRCLRSVNYPDTSFTFRSKRGVMGEKCVFVKSNEIRQICEGEICNKHEWNRVESDTIILFIFKDEVLDTTDWTMENYHKLVYRRYFLSYDDLMARQCTVTVE